MKPVRDPIGATRKQEQPEALMTVAESRLPIGVIVPTLNVRAALTEHLMQMRTWLGSVEEVLVVDSFSTDGTFELLQAELHHPGLRLFQCPPGLYQAWNYGIERLAAPFAYISTIGDPITPEGLRHLAATAEDLRSDVVISPPEFLDASARPLNDRRWPIHNLLDWSAAQQPLRVKPWRVFLAATLDVPQGILGSSASNLYRTAILRRFPFPSEYGHEADTAWGIARSLDVSWALTPSVFSKFRFHSTASLLNAEDKAALVGRLLDLARQTLHRAPDHGSVMPLPEGLLSQLREVPAAVEQLYECQRRYDLARRRFQPWSLNPAAWQARAQRNRCRSLLRKSVSQILQFSA